MIHYYAIGDIHGDYRTIRSLVQRNIQLHRDVANGDENVLICLGDFGGNYFLDYRDDDFKERLMKYPFTYFVVRGNHEERASICMQKNPEAWHTEEYFGNIVYVENVYPYIKYALDYPAVYSIDSARTLIIPGAYSVDKGYRLANGWNWFEGEQLTKEEMEQGLQLIEEYQNRFDLVLSHTCPIMYEPRDLFLSFIDQEAVDKTMERYLGNIEYVIDYKLWMWGHYHAERCYPDKGDGMRIMLFKQAVKLDGWLSGEKNVGNLI